MRSSSQERTTLPWRQISAIAATSRSNSVLPLSSAKPSAYACIIPYSMPLWIILTKWPAPPGPQCSQPASGAGARIFANGSTMLRRLGVAAEHQRIAVVQSPDAARHAAVDEAHARRRQRRAAPLRVLVVGVAAVDDHVAAREFRPDLLERELGDASGRQHQPDDARRRQACASATIDARGFEHAFAGERRRAAASASKPTTLDAAARQPPRHVAAHAAQSDDADLHSGGFSEGNRDATGSAPARQPSRGSPAASRPGTRRSVRARRRKDPGVPTSSPRSPVTFALHHAV